MLRIADLKGRVKSLKQQVMTAMDQAEKSSALSRKVSSLEEQMSALRSKIVRLEDGKFYMVEITESTSGQLICKSLRSLKYSCIHARLIVLAF
jgi:predicted  nucleic acid-binding Zn-ribbon protein